MPNEDFDSRLELLLESLVEIALEYVNFNEDEVETIYFFGSPANDGYFNNFFYKINGEIVAGRRINTLLRNPVDLSSERATGLFSVAAQELAQLAALFKKNGHPVPRTIRLVYGVQDGALQLQPDHELPAAYLREGQMASLFMDWLDAVKEDESKALAPFTDPL